MSPTPASFQLPPSHASFREHQLDSILWCLDVEGVGCIEAPTGSGKTALAAAVASRRSVTSLCKTKMVQRGNYELQYNFEAHYGRANYDCIHPDAPPGLTAAQCLHAEEGMHHCKFAGACPYLQSKAKVLSSPKASLNYAYWMTAHNWREWHAPSVAFCDEAHNLAKIVLDWVGCTVTDRHRVDWSLPNFPLIKRASGSGLFVQSQSNPTGDAIGWLTKARTELVRQYRSLQHTARTGSAKDRRLLADCEHLGRKVRSALDALQAHDDDWYIRSGPEALHFGRQLRPGFVAKPLTARWHAPHFFFDSWDAILMSATIGDFPTFARELGITRYAKRIVPNRFAPERRPVFALDVPRMGGKREDMKFDAQADAIADFIKLWPPDWPGLVHVSRITEEKFLAHRLQGRGLDDRVWYIRQHQEGGFPTDAQLAAWQGRKAQVPNSILVTCSFGEGYDGLDEKINVSAKVPFPRMGSDGSYEREWMKYSRSRYDQEAAKLLAQALGRTRRGRECDYDTSDEVRGAVAVADGSLGRVRARLPQDVQDALVEL